MYVLDEAREYRWNILLQIEHEFRCDGRRKCVGVCLRLVESMIYFCVVNFEKRTFRGEWIFQSGLVTLRSWRGGGGDVNCGKVKCYMYVRLHVTMTWLSYVCMQYFFCYVMS